MIRRHLASLLVALVILNGLAGCSRAGGGAVASADGVTVSFDFDDRGPLTQGDAVMFRGFEIGRVTKVTLSQKVRVDTFLKAQYAKLIPSCAYGFGSADWIGTGSIDIVVVDDSALPLPKGSVLPGVTTTAGRVNIESKLRLARAMERAKGALAGDGIDQGLSEARRLAGEGAEAAKRGLGELDDAARGGIRAGLDSARDELGVASEAAGAMARDAWNGSKRLAGEALDTAKDKLGGQGVIDTGRKIAAEGAQAVGRGLTALGADGALDAAKEKGAALYDEGKRAIGEFIDDGL